MKVKELTEEEKKRRFWTVCKLPFFGLVEELRITNKWLVNEDLRVRTFDMIFGQFFSHFYFLARSREKIILLHCCCVLLEALLLLCALQ